MPDWGHPDRRLCGWRVRSDLPLPELPVWTGDDRAPEVAVRLGPVPETLAKVAAIDPHGDIGIDGTFLLREPGVGRYLVTGDSLVTVAPEINAGSPLVRAHLYGTILGVLCHRRGLLPLHAGCVVQSGRAVLFAGARGSGKSMLAAALCRRGFALAADDVTPIVWPEGAGPTALPSVPCPRLTEAAIEALKLPRIPALDPVRGPAYGKMAMPEAATPWPEPAPIDAVFHLTPDPEAACPRLLPLGRSEAVGLLYASCFRGRLAHKMGLGAAAFAAVARLAAQCPSYRLVWRHDPAGLDALARLVADAAGEGAASSWT